MILWKLICVVFIFDCAKSLSEDNLFEEDDLKHLAELLSAWKRIIHRFPEALWMLNSFPHIRSKNLNSDDFFPTFNNITGEGNDWDDQSDDFVSITSRYSTNLHTDFSVNGVTTKELHDNLTTKEQPDNLTTKEKFDREDITSTEFPEDAKTEDTSLSYLTDGKLPANTSDNVEESSFGENSTVSLTESTDSWSDNDTDALVIAIIELLKNESGLIKSIKDFINRRNTKCNRDLWYTVRSKVDRSLTLEMVDAAGKPAAGLKRGNVRWLGDYRQCQDITFPTRRVEGKKKTESFGGFSGLYCYTSWKLFWKSTTDSVPLASGICVPDSCSAEDLKADYEDIVYFLRKLPILKLRSSLKLTDVTCQSRDRKWSGGDIAYMFVLVVFMLLIIGGTSYDLLKNYLKKENVNSQRRKSGLSANGDIPDVVVPNETISIAVGKERTYGEEVPLSIQSSPTDETRQLPGKLFGFLLCFSAYSNASKVLTVGNQQGQISSLHGIRFLSLSWVIFGHVFVYAMTSVGNIVDALNDIDSFAFQAISQATFAVDSFFLLSGLLLSYLYFKECQKTNGKTSWIYYYVHRIWRLTPAFAMLLGFYTTLWLHTGSGPLWPAETDGGNCKKSWWWNLLYIVNFHDVNHNCMGWTWYLANDMQFYIVSPIFLILLWKLPVIGVVVVSVATIASWITTGVLSAANDFRLFTSATENLDLADLTKVEESQWTYFNTIYDKPYCRIGPYLIGLLLGYALYRTSGRQRFLSFWMLIVGWVVATAVGISVVFGIYHVPIGRITAAFYNALARSAWSLALAWVIFVCVTGHAGPVNKFLSWKFWIPLSRLTYCAYLIHPMIMTWYYSSIQTMLHFQMNTMVLFYFGFLGLAYLLAFVASVAFESPMMALEKFVLKSFSK